MDKLIFLDTETTGNEVEKDRLCQVCYKTSDGIYTEYFKPPIPVSIKSMSITNITNKMLEDKEAFADSEMKKDLEARLADGGILVAHNANFDCAILEAEGMSIPRRICTLRVARSLDSDNLIPEYNLAYLRYHLDLDVENSEKITAHDAESDVLVLYALFKRLLDKMMQGGPASPASPPASPNRGESLGGPDGGQGGLTEEEAIAKMLDISNKPVLFRVFNFGKYKDKKIEEVAKIDRGYLQWMLGQKMADGGKDEDWIHTLDYFLKQSWPGLGGGR